MSVTIPAKLPNDDYNALVRLSRFSGVPLSEVAGILLCYVLDYRDPSFLGDVIPQYLSMYRGQLTIRSAIITSKGDHVPVTEEVIFNEPTTPSDP